MNASTSYLIFNRKLYLLCVQFTENRKYNNTGNDYCNLVSGSNKCRENRWVGWSAKDITVNLIERQD